MWGDISLWFWFAFPCWLMMLSIFSCTCWSSLEKCVFSSSAYFLIGLFGFLELSCMNSLYILDINPLSNIWFANIFSYSVCCLFILLMVSFAVEKLFSLMQFHLFIFAFVACVFGVISKKSLPRPMSRNLSSMISARSFMVLHSSL